MSTRVVPCLLLAFFIYLIDQLTKTAIKKTLTALDTVRVTPFLSLVYVENTGSAFGMFRSLGNAFFITISIVAVAFIGFLIYREPANRLAYSLLIAGALGNMTDRVIYGYVVDFIDLHIGNYHWYAFNVADASLTVGMVLLIVNTFFGNLTRKG